MTDSNVSIDCVISDHDRQTVTGLEFLQKIRVGNNLGVNRNLRFVILTGDGDKEVVRAALTFDVDAHAMKSIFQGGLVSSIERAFTRKSMLKSGPEYGAIEISKT